MYLTKPCSGGPRVSWHDGHLYCPKGHECPDDMDWEEWCEICTGEYYSFCVDSAYDLARDGEWE